MADWSQLPPELLLIIGKRLKARFDVLRFRSFCSSWRSSVPPKVYTYPFPKHLPSKTIGRCKHSLSNITRNTFYLIRSSQAIQTQASACWSVKICDGIKMRLVNPLTDSELRLVPGNFPMVLDLNNFQVIELGHEYIARSRVFVDHRIKPQSWDYIEKVVYLRSSTDGDSFTMLGFILHFPKCLAFLRSGENDWTLLEAADDVRDIVSFNGKFYAIEQKGRTMVIDQSLNVSFLEHVGSSNSIMFLVKCVDNLLAVEMLFDTDAENTLSYGRLLREKAVGFKVFKMNEKEQRWDEMGSLRDRILFLGFHQAISAPAFEFGWGRGNLIFFSECVPGHDTSEDRRMFVFDLETGTASPLENCPAYCNLFWPPPQWVASPTEDITDSTHSVTSTSPETECKYPESDLAISTTASSARKIDNCLAVLRSRVKEWIVLKNVHGALDIISFSGKFYAIDYKGRTIVIDRTLNVSFLGPVGSGSAWSRKLLAKSVDNLLAVEMPFPRPLNPAKVGFRVLRLNEEEQKWMEIESLKDRIFFLGFHQAISAPALENGRLEKLGSSIKAHDSKLKNQIDEKEIKTLRHIPNDKKCTRLHPAKFS
ncbi:hypothetical protein V6N13_115227 [Hibiscus sabdariffa]|uniref:KIB1-4 beta-propeller domain-containing protein n=1 Tax=Hibiscus sabdariffa TaxID=183260 RepID=A0ABR2CR45_9ROSI